MTSAEQIEANRKNGARSRGPRTTGGKARSSRNALGHGLTANILKDPVVGAEAQRLAQALAGPNPSSARLAQASAIAQARIELVRIREEQFVLTESIFSPHMAREDPVNADWEVFEIVLRWHDYERKILSRLKRAMRAFRFSSDD